MLVVAGSIGVALVLLISALQAYIASFMGEVYILMSAFSLIMACVCVYELALLITTLVT